MSHAATGGFTTFAGKREDLGSRDPISMRRVYLHLGMPKTGTTFLQTSCFPFLSGLRYNDSELIRLLDKIAYTNPAFLELDSLKLEATRIVNSSGDKLLIS